MKYDGNFAIRNEIVVAIRCNDCIVYAAQSQISDKCLEVGKKARSREEGHKTSETIDLVLVVNGVNTHADTTAAARLADCSS